MPELPEITCRSAEMKKELTGKMISEIEVIQPKSLNISENEFKSALVGAEILDVYPRGKWIITNTSQGWLLINLGMGGELLHTQTSQKPEKRRLSLEFDDNSSLCINFWWFGYAHFIPISALNSHAMTAKLGPNALEMSPDQLQFLLKGKRGALKTFMLDQSKIAGIGNAYIHDILWFAYLHPLRVIDSLDNEDIARLFQAIKDGLLPSIKKGGAFYEVNLYGEKGGFSMEDIFIGYKEGKDCPRCGTTIEKIKTGSTSSFICPSCQKY